LERRWNELAQELDLVEIDTKVDKESSSQTMGVCDRLSRP